MAHTRQLFAFAAIAAVTLGLAGCVNGPQDGAEWLQGQAGIASVEVLDSDENLSGATGQLRGELDADISNEQLDSLVNSVAGYLRSNDLVSIRLGYDDVDFGVDPSGSNEGAVELWRRVIPVPGVISAFILDNSVHVRALRADMAGIHDELGAVEADLRIEGFADETALADDEALDNESGDAVGNAASLDFVHSADCRATPEQIELAVSMFERETLAGARLELCNQFTLYYGAAATLSTELPAVQEQLIAAGMGSFSVTAEQQVAGTIGGRTAVVTPVVDGDPAAFALFAVFESPGSVDPFLTLSADRSFEVLQYEVPLADLVGLVTSSPAASSAPFIRIEGVDAAVGGSASDLAGLAVQAVALASASPQFTNVELSVQAGILTLQSPVATDPDVAAAVADLRASQAWVGRSFAVTYLQTQLTIVDGVATVDAEYTDGHVVQQFAEAWNAG